VLTSSATNKIIKPIFRYETEKDFGWYKKIKGIKRTTKGNKTYMFLLAEIIKTPLINATANTPRAIKFFRDTLWVSSVLIILSYYN
jgi:hypothetical protein